ncbi:DUF1801 domain-containing protein [Ferrimonas marina]|uniref:YdhG-like domain-containing protein n=1 Tax=Ferrimonas marina TaxID=299255 RepID=A0A1M5YS86_9GAMM|nr:DUF1801 domain-containing protein [Ferrimonas marina]SHI14956.1 hypothetical protein SAMN02745129_4376 [Ferrimonas marina]
MTALKTRPNACPVQHYLAGITDNTRRLDGEALVTLFARVTGYRPVMWGDSIVGFGQYHYRNSAGEFSWLMTGFSVRSRNLTLYVMQGFEGLETELARLGKLRHAKSCLYLPRLASVDVQMLEGFLEVVVADMRRRYPCSEVDLSSLVDDAD